MLRDHENTPPCHRSATILEAGELLQIDDMVACFRGLTTFEDTLDFIISDILLTGSPSLILSHPDKNMLLGEGCPFHQSQSVIGMLL